RGAIAEFYDFDHHQVFEGVTTYSCVLLLTKKSQSSFLYTMATQADVIPGEPAFGKINLADLNEDRWRMLTDDARPIIDAIERAGRPLGEIARLSVGLATLADACYVLSGERRGDGYLAEAGGAAFSIEPGITRPILKASLLKSEPEIVTNRRRILFPYERIDGKHRIIPEGELRDAFPNAHAYLRAIRATLAKRDRGKPNSVAWYAFGRSQGLDNNFGTKLLTSGMNLAANFVYCDDPDTTFYSGYCVRTDAFDLRALQRILNSPLMDFYMRHTSRSYQNGYKSYAKSFIKTFGVPELSGEEVAYVREAEVGELVAFLLERYGLACSDHPALDRFLRDSPKLG
ncbi:MAG: hypothetical protein O3A46_16190, partial [Candidatus Poribacteria bacterium]|nr:hypothetical protein [Candidatus Poribacteria bacterium]